MRTYLRNRLAVLALAATLAAGCGPAGPAAKTTPSSGFESIFNREKITIAVTDSGLGGLSIMAEAAARLQAARSFRSVDLVFWNALFSNDSGYNDLASRAEKIRIFDSALRSLAATLKPDLILVGCNTLSVLLGDTPFARETRIPIAGIVDAGVVQLNEALAASPRAVAFLFGTKTTIAEGEHRRKLVAAGIADSRLIPQPCPSLVGRIEADWRGKEAEDLIAKYVGEAADRLSDPSVPVFAALFCTHFGYADELWRKAFAARGLNLAGLINPNSRWIEPLDPPDKKNRFGRTDLRTRVVSMVEIPESVRTTLAAWLVRISPETAAALKSYDLVPGLFEWRSLVNK